jgi:hypothetical protein
MMSFGWRPQNSCYVSATKAPASDSQVPAAPMCAATPTWFYVLLGLAVVGGMSGGKGK